MYLDLDFFGDSEFATVDIYLGEAYREAIIGDAIAGDGYNEARTYRAV